MTTASDVFRRVPRAGFAAALSCVVASAASAMAGGPAWVEVTGSDRVMPCDIVTITYMAGGFIQSPGSRFQVYGGICGVVSVDWDLPAGPFWIAQELAFEVPQTCPPGIGFVYFRINDGSYGIPEIPEIPPDVLAVHRVEVVPTAAAFDLNNDRRIDAIDLSIMLASFGDSVTPGDFGDGNRDGLVNNADLSMALASFGIRW